MPPSRLVSVTAARRGWLLEFLMVGGSTVVLLPLAWLARTSLGLDAAELAVGFVTFHAASLINDPHFSVTYLLFYRRWRQRAFGGDFAPLQRARYLLAGAVVPLALSGWAGLAILRDSASALGSLIQLMFVLVGWHYVKQSFGVLAVLSARCGVRLGSPVRAALLGHCYASWIYAYSSPADPGTSVLFQGVLHGSLPHPPWLAGLGLAAFVLSGAALALVLLGAWRRQGRLPPLLPLSALLLGVWTWTVFTRLDPVFYYLIPALHSLQYLYFVALLSRNHAREVTGPPAFAGTLGGRLLLLAGGSIALGWLLLRGLPGLLDRNLMLGPSDDPAQMAFVGPTPFLAAFTAVVNVHHYFMDWVIWRRETPETRYLTSDLAAR